ncbi:MAG TPA: class I SAM-dependent methyltransferase [Longimicrobiales bacterium]
MTPSDTQANDRVAFWDHAVAVKGHTGYADRLRHDYDQVLRLRTVAGVLDRVWPQGLTGRNALDIGCGVGDFVALLRSRGAAVTAIDISPEVIAAARRRFAGAHDVTWLVGTIGAADLPADTFDVITSITVLQHVVDNEEFIKSLVLLRRCLRPQGRLIVLELAPPRASHVDVTDADGFVYLRERPPAEWEAAFARAGLRVVETPVFPQLGIALLRGLSVVVTRLTSRRRAGTGAGGTAAPAAPAMAAPPSLKRRAWDHARRALLLLARPFDHWAGLPLPAEQHRHYRCYVLSPATTE